MNHKILSFVFACGLAISTHGARAADAGAPGSVEGADRQFLTNLERGKDAQHPATEPAEIDRARSAVTPTAAKEQPVKSDATVRTELPPKKEQSPRVVTTLKKAPELVPQLKSEEPSKKQEVIEVRKAIPVTTVTTTVTKTARSEDQDDHADDNKFFHRLFHGERIFR